MSTWLVSLKPLAPYFFGGEQNYTFGGKDQPYFICSEKMPAQSTLLGMLRYVVLKRHKLLNRSPKETVDLIGPESFDMACGNSQEFGIIKKLSPVFLLDGDGQKYVPVPLNHKKGEKNYTPLRMKSVPAAVKTTPRISLLPLDYCVKTGLPDGMLCLQGRKVIPGGEIFKPRVQVGIRKRRPGENSLESSFFKKEFIELNADYHFAFYAKMDEPPLDTVVFLGQGKSPFQMTSKEEEDGLEAEVRQKLGTLNRSNEPFSYALSDVKMTREPYEYTGFSIDQAKPYRYQKTKNFSAENYWDKIGKSEKLFTLVRAGSVFYVRDKAGFETCCQNKELEEVGFNHMIEIGG